MVQYGIMVFNQLLFIYSDFFLQNQAFEIIVTVPLFHTILGGNPLHAPRANPIAPQLDHRHGT